MSFNLTDDLKFLKQDGKPSHKRRKEKERDFSDSKKRKKEKKSKKSKKERKKSKHKKHRKTSKKHSSESESDSDSDSGSDSWEERETYQPKRESDDDRRLMEFALFQVTDKTGGKKSDDKNRCIIDKPGQSARELNPYWKDGGTGLPKEKEVTDNQRSRLNFKKPSDETFSSHFEGGERRRNWMKKKIDEKESCSSEKSEPKLEIKEAKILTDAELNALAAKVFKAEITGNQTLVDKLKAELEQAKKRRTEAENQGSGLSTERTETIILTKTNRQGFTVPVDVPTGQHPTGSNRRKKHKVETHDSGQRLRYFPDDDKYSLKDMFVKEKATTAEDEERAIVNKLAKGSRRHRRGDDEEEEAMYLDQARYEESDEKKKTESLNEAKAKHKSLEGCKWCLENKNKSKHLIAEIGTKCYLCLPEETSLTEGHCLIVPIYHTPSGTATDEDVWEEIESFKNKLVDMFSRTGKEPIFFENARGLNRFPHMVLHCVPVDKEEGDMAPIYFKKALLESETEWSNNKKVVDLKKYVRRNIPKGLPYFAVTFGREGGFAHVIEDERLFPSNFAEEIIGGMLDLDHRIWRKHQKQDFNAQRDKFLKFVKLYRSHNSGSANKNEDDSSSSD